jgi:hypothetical protein
MKTALRLFAAAALATVSFTYAQERDERPEIARNLMEKAQQAKADGRYEEAKELSERAKKLQAEGSEAKTRREGSEPGDKLARVKQEIAELQRNGKREEAERLQHQLDETRKGESRGDVRSPEGEGQERLRHVAQAIEHLRAAGLTDMAKNLEQQARRMRAELEQRGDGEHRQKTRRVHGNAGADVQELRERVEQLAREVDKVREELKRQRGADADRKE